MNLRLLIAIFGCTLYWPLSAQWVSTQGPYGGYVYQMLSNEQYVFASKYSGIYRSSDEGLHWERCNFMESFGKLALDGSNILNCTSEADFGQMYFSADNGDHWENIPLPAGTPLLDNFTLKDSTILFTYLGKIWLSTDLGLNWESFDLPAEPFQHLKLLGHFEGLFYLGNNTRLLSSTDGYSWTYVGTVPGNSSNAIKKIFRRENEMISISGQTMGRSLNGGQQWVNGITENDQNLGANNEISYENGVYYLSTGKPMFKSLDHGLSWTYANESGPNIYYHTSKNQVILGHVLGLGALRSSDGAQTFNASNNGLGGGDVLTQNIHNNELWLWDETGITRHNTTQLNWDLAPTYPLSSWVGSFVSIFHTTNAVFIRKDHGELIRSMDAGQNWTAVTPDASIVSSDFVEFNLQGDSLFLSSEMYQTYLSTDLGTSWQHINPSINALIGANMKDMALQGPLAYVTDNQHIYRSNDHMLSWAKAGAPLPFGPDASWIRLFATPHFLFAYVNQERIFRSDDSAEHWTEVFMPFPPVFYNWAENEVSFAEIGTTVLAFFERGGLFISQDKGLTWDSFNQGIPFQESSASFGYNDDGLWLGTVNFGLYHRSKEDLMPVRTSQPISEAQLLQFYPNPAQGVFQFKLPIVTSGEATLVISDLQGREIAHLSTLAEHLNQIDLSNYPKGLYCVTIRTDKTLYYGKVAIQ